MIVAPIPENESFRLKALKDYSILDTLPEVEYDDITQLASQICGTPISSISLIDEKRQWFKSKVGLNASETSREDAFCAHAILEPNKILTVKDSTKDSRFFDNPFVVNEPHVVFYAGVPLVSPDGMALGTLCVMDDKPKELDELQLKTLKALSNQVVSLFELRKSKMLLEKFSKDLENRNFELEKFANVAAHDIKSPLNNISSLTQILIEEYSEKLDISGKNFLSMLNTSSEILRKLVDGILQHSKTDFIITNERELVNFEKLVSEIITLLDVKKEYQFNLIFQNQEIHINKVGIQQILINLIANSIKYNDKEYVTIEIDFFESELFYHFSVKDNGCGIDEKSQKKIFNIFEVLTNSDRFGNRGNGIGLSTVKKLVDEFGGTIIVNSTLNEGTKISFSISKFN
ncbi:MAG: GAF domain-containing protein [Flavobacterium sp.]|nr:GAF domain-containing protein [Flavobacterium sp.]